MRASAIDASYSKKSASRTVAFWEQVILLRCWAPLISFKDKDAASRSQSQLTPGSSHHQAARTRKRVHGKQDCRIKSAATQLLLMGWRKPRRLLRYVPNSVKFWYMETRNRIKPGNRVVPASRCEDSWV